MYYLLKISNLKSPIRIGLIALVAILIAIGIRFRFQLSSFANHLGVFTRPRVCATTDGSILFFNTVEGDLFRLDRGTDGLTQLTFTDEIEEYPALSPSEQHLVYTSTSETTEGSIYLRSLVSNVTTRLTNEIDCRDIAPAFSPDGSRIAFARSHLYRKYSLGGMKWDCWDIYLVNTDGSNLKRLSNENYYDISRVEFSSDGEAIYYSAVARDASNSEEFDQRIKVFAIKLNNGTEIIDSVADHIPQKSKAEG